MTSRRAAGHHEQRVSRALQFVPGHAGGRVASAQPVIRRDGTLRRPAVGTTGAAPACVDFPPPYDDTAPGNQAWVTVPGPCTIHVTVAESPGALVLQVDLPDVVVYDEDATLAAGEWSATFAAIAPAPHVAWLRAKPDVSSDNLTLTSVRVCPL